MRHVISLGLLLSISQANAEGTVQDYYSPIVRWQQPSAEPVQPIHVALLPNGNLFFTHPTFGMATSQYNTSPPALAQIEPMRMGSDVTYDPATGIETGKNISCSGHALMADGNLFFGGGTYTYWNRNNPGQPPEGAIVSGISESVTYNPFSNTWINNPDSIGIGTATGKPLRWYPTVTRLADSRMLLTGGYEQVVPVFAPHNRSVEVFNPTANAWTVVSDFINTPEGIANPDYTHVFQLPMDHFDPQSGTNHDLVLMLGGSGEPVLLFLNGQQSIWHASHNFRPGAQAFVDRSAPAKVNPNHGSSSAMLPIRLPEASWGYTNGSVINVGGEHGSIMEASIDVYDPGLNQWRPSIPMNSHRHHPNATILPDGRILILAGHADEGVDQTGYAEYIDPKNSFAHTVGVAHMPEVRGYHSMTVLLPDGRVFIGGGSDDGHPGTEKANFRYYYPDYMFKKRPEIEGLELTIKVNNYFPLVVPHLSKVDEVSLLALGSMTHSIDMGQRSVQLRLIDGRMTVKRDAQNELVPAIPSECVGASVVCFDQYFVQSPTTRELAPPGHYMLFVLDKNRVPSLGKIIKLEP